MSAPRPDFEGSTLDDLPRLRDHALVGSFGATTADRMALQRALTTIDAPLARGRILHLPAVFPCTPEAAHEVLVTKAKSFEKSPGLRVLLQPLAGQGLFTSEGALWRRQRKLMAPLFQPQPIHAYAELIRQVAERAADRMRPGEAIDLAHETTRIAMSAVGKALFDVGTFDEADDLAQALTTCLSWVNGHISSPALVAHVLLLDATAALSRRGGERRRRFFDRLHERASAPFLLPGVRAPELVAATRVLDERIQAMIDDRRASGLSRDDLMTRLLTAIDAETGERMDDRQVRDEAVTLFVAGHETTATALAWSFYLLARHPEHRARAQAEADALGDGPIGAWEPGRLPFLTQVFREALRLYPPLMFFARRSLEAVEIQGVALPARTITLVSAYALHRRAASFPDPERFVPERWTAEEEARRHRSAFLPFGAGPRVCIGLHFAMLEGPLVLAVLLRRHRFEIDPAATIEPDDFATLRPRGGVPAVVRARA